MTEDIDLFEEPVTLPCGCMIMCQENLGRKEFVMKPCNLDCTYYQFAMEETKRQGKPVYFRRDDVN